MIFTNLRERITAILNFEEPDQIGYYDWFWAETIDRWRSEGMPDSCATYSPMHSHWGFGAYLEGLPVEIGIRTISCVISPKYEQLTLEETREKLTIRDEWGVKTQFWKTQSGMPHALESPITNLDDFKEKIEPLMNPDTPDRISSPRYPFKEDVEHIIKRMQEKYFVMFSILGPFEITRHLFGSKVDKILITIMKNRDFASYVINFIGNVIAKTAKVFIDFGVDGLFLLDDLGYKNGPFFAPIIFEKLFKPIYVQITSPYRKRHLPILLHSCGDIRPHIPHLIDSGITALNPLEVKAGMDVLKLKEEYGDKLVFVGGIDVRTLESTPQNINAEVKKKISVAGHEGGYIIGSDHSVPPTVSYQNYMYFLELIKKYGRYPLSGTENSLLPYRLSLKK